MTLDVRSDGKFPPAAALNEAWLEKTVPGHTVHMRLGIGGVGVHHLRRRRADREHAHRFDGVQPLGARPHRVAHDAGDDR